jgi:dolichol-phosphate mannosyltransferase
MKDAHTYSSFYRAYKSVTLQKAVNAFGDTFIKSPGFAAAAEILIKLRRLGARIDEIPMVLKYDERAGSSKMNVWKTILEYLVLLSRETAVEVAHRPGRTDRRIP